MGSLTIEELKALIWQAIQEWNDRNSDHNRCLTSLDIIDHVGHITCQIKPSELEVEYEGEPLFANTMYLIDFIIGPDSQDDLQDISLSSENPILRNLKVDSANVLDATSPDPILELKCTHSSDHFEDLLAKTVTRGMQDISTISHVCDVVYNTELPTSKIGITTSELLNGVEKMETKRNAEPKSEKTYEFESRVLSIKEMETFEWDGALYDGTDCPHIPLLGRWPIGVITAVSRDDETKLRTQQRHYVYLSVPKPPCHCSWMCRLNIVSHISTAAYSLGCILSLQNGATTLLSGIKTHVKHEHSKLLQCLVDHWSEVDETELVRQMVAAYELELEKGPMPSEKSTTSSDEDETDADDPKTDHESYISPQDAYKSKYHFTSSGLTHIAKIYKVGATRPDDTQTYATVDVGELETYGYIEYALNPKAAKFNNMLNGFKLWLVVQNDGDVWLELRDAVGQVKRSVYLDNACEYAPPPKQYRAYRVLPETLDDTARSKVMDALGRAWLTCHAAYSRYPEVRKTHQDAWHYGSYDSDDISYEEFSRHYGIWVDAHDPVWPKFEIMKL